MSRSTPSDEPVSLTLEVTTGTAILNGDKAAELPPREFSVLVQLGARPREGVSFDDLMAAVWPGAHWMTKHDLAGIVSRTRRAVKAKTGISVPIRNRRGFGYVLDMDPGKVRVIEGLSTQVESDLPDDPPTEAPVALTDEVTEELGSPIPEPEVPELHGAGAGRRVRIPVGAALIAALLMSWSAGYVLANRDAERSRDEMVAPAPAPSLTATPSATPSPPSQEPKKADRNKGVKRRGNKAGRRSGGGPTIAAGGTSGGGGSGPVQAQGSTSTQQGSSHPTKKETRSAPGPAEKLPAPPTRYLYHLYNPDAGDHFVTTDNSKVSEYEGRGYSGGAVARVYTHAEKGTKALATNYGPAYAFVDSAPKTDPAIKTVAIWYSSNGSGDYFYTTSKNEATKAGWSGYVIGYGRSL